MLAPLARREHPGQRLRRWGSASPHAGRYLLCRAVRPLGWLNTSPTPIFNGLPFVTPASVRVHIGLAELRVVMIGAASACGFGVRARHGRDTEAGRRQKWAPIEGARASAQVVTCLFRGGYGCGFGPAALAWTCDNDATSSDAREKRDLLEIIVACAVIALCEPTAGRSR